MEIKENWAPQEAIFREGYPLMMYNFGAIFDLPTYPYPIFS